MVGKEVKKVKKVKGTSFAKASTFIALPVDKSTFIALPVDKSEVTPFLPSVRLLEEGAKASTIIALRWTSPRLPPSCPP